MEEEKMVKEEEKRDDEDQPIFLEEAKYLAESYTHMLEMRKQLKARIDGDWTYTKEMAIADLDNISVSYDGERVQSSNISNPTERIAMKLTDRYMAKKQEEMYRERDALVRAVDYLDWKIDIVLACWKERTNSTERAVFQLLYYQHKTFKEAEKILLRKRNLKLADRSIVKIKEKIWGHFEAELYAQMQTETGREYMEKLTGELEDNGKYEGKAG